MTSEEKEIDAVFGGMVAVALNHAKRFEPKYSITFKGKTSVYKTRAEFIKAFKKSLEQVEG